MLKKIGVDEITAEEIAKEAVDRAVRAFRPGIAKFLTFTTRIALNIRIDRLRKGSLLTQRPEALDDNLLRPQGLVTNSEIPITEDDIGERSEFMKKIDSVIHLISQEDRVLIQFDIQDVPKESYMQIFNISKEAYRQRKSRAYHKLQELIQPKKEGGLIAKGV